MHEKIIEKVIKKVILIIKEKAKNYVGINELEKEIKELEKNKNLKLDIQNVLSQKQTQINGIPFEDYKKERDLKDKCLIELENLKSQNKKLPNKMDEKKVLELINKDLSFKFNRNVELKIKLFKNLFSEIWFLELELKNEIPNFLTIINELSIKKEKKNPKAEYPAYGFEAKYLFNKKIKENLLKILKEIEV